MRSKGRPQRGGTNKTSGKTGGQIRLIGGQWRGRKLPVTDVTGLRPTTDRVRETLFNWLMHDVRGARVLDCFAGSGALSLEALSRHAEHATLLELDAGAARQLEANLVTLGRPDAKVVKGDSLQWLNKPADTPYDIVFVDPPFRQDLLTDCCDALDANGYLQDGSLIYIETEQELALPHLPASWRLEKEKIAGQVAYRLYRKENAQ